MNAVSSGTVALNTIQQRPSTGITILLIDLDQTPLSYTPEECSEMPSAKKHDSGVDVEEMNGMEFLKAVADGVNSGRMRNVYPIGWPIIG